MKILILGGDGMLGHELLMLLRTQHDAKVTLRQPLAAYADYGLFTQDNTFCGIDVRLEDRLAAVFSNFRPDALVNAAGIVKQRPEGGDVIESLEVNALLPHRLARFCRAVGTRLVHLSTDCVFSGERGGYRESDRTDPVDLYGRSKLLGEVAGEGAITLRTSMIGLGLRRKTGLVDWFLAQKGRIAGYRNAIFSGLTTSELARVIRRLLERHAGASGVYHLSAARISKYDLLVGLGARLGSQVEIQPVDEPRIDRSLDSSRFRTEFSYAPPSWGEMLDELATSIRSNGE